MLLARSQHRPTFRLRRVSIMLKLVIFDLDGTLMDAYEAIYRSFNYTMERIGCPCREEQVIRRAVGWGDRNLLKPFVRARDLDAALAIYRRHHAVSLRENTRLFPGVKGMLAGLRKKGVRLAVASNRPTRFSLIALNALGIRKNGFISSTCEYIIFIAWPLELANISCKRSTSISLPFK